MWVVLQIRAVRFCSAHESAVLFWGHKRDPTLENCPYALHGAFMGCQGLVIQTVCLHLPFDTVRPIVHRDAVQLCIMVQRRCNIGAGILRIGLGSWGSCIGVSSCDSQAPPLYNKGNLFLLFGFDKGSLKEKGQKGTTHEL